MNISVVIIAKNSEKTIEKTLKSLVDFNDVVVYDNGSTDNTIKHSKKFENVNLVEGEFKGFGWTKNKAISYAKNDWILILDSDEVVDSKLLNTLQNKKLEDDTVYLLNFNAYYKEKQVKYCGWSGQKIKRMFNKKVTKINDNMVHEDIIIEGLKLEVLEGNVEHYSYSSISDFLQKTDKYSSIFANDYKNKKKSTPLKAFFRATYFFIKNYIFRRGFLDGYIGLLVCVSGANGVFYKYLKLYEENNNL
ncbi:glycosyltransferase family 2 protein [Arcobacter porcinus]|uniref:SPBc2 prophage-derived glycosyltransferase SunS n=1 Tax=Arcobacter porcinus TaxID=1935204 RepID=A0ABX2YA00_9BACT|nr:glycosyltransferase family 2 protein [Arcobacter porcinus]OCL89935.1 SPBc2 prophage-derived glycosyltransferase SunS [Arcobacter porcinus]